jgi:murein DD-endopeptidase MepM/ murein hydrolase activator NlpD
MIHTQLVSYGQFLWQYTVDKSVFLATELSQILRPLAESNRFKTIVGVNLASAILIVKLMGDVGGPVQFEPIETALLNPESTQVLTETRFRFPLEENQGYSQGFHRFHPGVDIRASRGTTIYPVADGEVVETKFDRWGLGHKVVIKHQNELLTTLYAHLDEVNVKVGDKLTKNTPIGNVGMTGWTTGPHLHFETETTNGFINPKQVLPNPIFPEESTSSLSSS